MKKIFPFIIAFILLSASAAMAQDPNPAGTPSSDAQYISLLREYTLNADGSMDYRYVKEQKLITYRAFHSLYGETFVTYNPSFQKLTVNKCFTVMADGKTVETPSNAFNEILPSFAAGAPPFNQLRDLVITHTGLERGAVIHLDYNIHTTKGNAPALMGNEVMAEYEPVEDFTVRVKIPQQEKLYYKLVNGAGEPLKSTENDMQVYTWNVKNVPAISPEDFQASMYEAYPRIIFSSSGSRDMVLEYLTSQAAMGLKISDAMKAGVLDLKKDNPDPLSLALKLQGQVIDDIHLWPVPMKYNGYRLHTAEQAWNSMGANLPEKAVLLAALLEAAGTEADVVAVTRDAFFDEKMGTLAEIEDFAVSIDLKDAGLQYLSIVSPNSQDLGKVQSDKVFIALGQGEKPKYRHPGQAKFAVNMSGAFIVSSDPKLTGELSLGVAGAVNPYFGLLRDKNKMKNLVVGGLSKADLKDIKLSQSSTETSFQTYTIMNEKPFRKDSSWVYFTLPYCSSGIDSWGIKTLPIKRMQAVEIPYQGEENYEYSLTLPSGWALFSPAGKSELSNKAGRYLFEIKQEGSNVSVSRKIKLSSRIILSENYGDFKALMDNWNDPRKKEVIFTLK